MSNLHNTDEQPSNFDRQQLYRSLLTFIDTTPEFSGENNPPLIAYVMQDGSFKFSLCDPLEIVLKVLTESRLSDRLLVIVSVAYVEDQIRLLLAKFLAKDQETEKLLDPENGPLPLLTVARFAFSSGLIAKEWFEILKEMASLRNRFAHQPFAQSFDDLLQDEPKQISRSINRLSNLYLLLTGEPLEGTNFEKFSDLFQLMYVLLQFAMDHIAMGKSTQVFTYSEISNFVYFEGHTRHIVQEFLAGNFKKL